MIAEIKLICPICKSELSSAICKKCSKNYWDKYNDMLDFEGESKSEVEIKYDELNTKKNKDIYGRYSFFLNMGVKENNSNNDGLRSCSLNLLKILLDNVNVENKKILEVGCGRGGNLFYMKNFNTGCLVGLDITKSSLNFCKSKKTEILFIRGSAEKLPFAAETFDILLNIESSSHYNAVEFFREAYRVLSEKGKILFADMIKRENKITYIRKLKEIGFKIIEWQDITDKVLESMKTNIRLTDEHSIFDHSLTMKKLSDKTLCYLTIIGEK